MITRSILLQMAASRKMEHFSSHNRLAKGFAMRFIASEKMEDVTLPVRRLNSKGLSVSLDYLGEGVTTEEESWHKKPYRNQAAYGKTYRNGRHLSGGGFYP